MGGLDFPGQALWRRKYEGSEPVSLDLYTTMMASRCEYQIRTYWDLQPGLFSLAFASRVNLGQPMAIRRALRRGAGEEDTDESTGDAAKRIYQLLHTGKYEDALGRRVPVRGDISKIMKIIGLTNTEKRLSCRIFTSCQAASPARGKSRIPFDTSSSPVAYFIVFLCS